jgi:methylated-DNA-[protein]-cysteine S-methyltransferase
MNSHQYEMKSGAGSIWLIASDRGLSGLYWERQAQPMAEGLRSDVPAHAILKDAVRQIGEYLSGARREFDLPLDICGTPFQESVWKALRGIPFGTTISYKELAERIENPKAVRAVGSANGRNPVCIVIPCHRVIAADGTLGGYAGGLPNKRRLLAVESVHIP